MIRLIFIILSGHISAQTTFFVSPKVSTKAELSSSIASSNQKDVFNSSSFFEYKNQNIIYPRKFSPILLGIDLGVSFNNRIKISIGASQDGGSSGAKLLFYTYEANTDLYINNQTSYYKGYSFGRYQFSSKFRLIHKKNNNLYFDLGLGLFHRAGGVSLNPDDIEEHNYLINENSGTIKLTSELYKSNNRSMFLLFGFSDEISIGKNYIGDIGIFYLMSKNILSIVNSKIQVSTTSENRTYSYNSVSKGNGIYIELSRKIQFYPWQRLKRKGEIKN